MQKQLQEIELWFLKTMMKVLWTAKMFNVIVKQANKEKSFIEEARNRDEKEDSLQK
jgi:hypothetical protein